MAPSSNISENCLIWLGFINLLKWSLMLQQKSILYTK